MSLLNKISFYQLENLILQRVPFKFVELFQNSSADELAKESSLDAFKHLNPYYQRFFKEQFLAADLDQIVKGSSDFILSFESPIILICQDGLSSNEFALALEKVGYKNIYLIEGGLTQLLADAKMAAHPNSC